VSLATTLLDRGLIPDPLIRVGIRRLLAERLAALESGSEEERQARFRELVEELRRSPIALHTERANEQHYELPAELFRQLLGARLKYSCGYWPPGVSSLDRAEERMLELYVERAEIEDGQDVLDLGCGWGSLSLYLAQRFPRCRILAVSNSRSQGDLIRSEAARRGLGGLEVHTADVTGFEPARRFDRIVSIEMFEHLRNYRLLFERLAFWMRPGAKLFVHVFCHRRFAYPFEVSDPAADGPGDWMARHFFTGGLMPSADLLPHFRGALDPEERWLVNGEHYRRTAEAWLENLDRRRPAILPLLERAYGRRGRARWLRRWRVFFMSCAELFGYRDGEEWMVAHYRFRKPEATAEDASGA